MRRVFGFALGLGLGMVVGGAAVRRLEEAQQRFAPDRLAAAALERVERTRARLGGAPWTP